MNTEVFTIATAKGLEFRESAWEISCGRALLKSGKYSFFVDLQRSQVSSTGRRDNDVRIFVDSENAAIDLFGIMVKSCRSIKADGCHVFYREDK